MAGDEWHGSLFYVIGNYSVMFLEHKKALRAGFFLNFKFQNPEKFIIKKRQTNVLKTLPFLKWVCYYISKEREYMFGKYVRA